MIPKTIHYCWFGNNKKPQLVKDCIKSWEKLHPDYKIIEWNEKNFPIDNDFLHYMYNHEKWAFVSDYARLKILYEYGGYYLDTDMILVKRLDSLEIDENTECVLGAEDENFISCGFIGCKKENNFILSILEYYKNSYSIGFYKPIPEIFTEIFKKEYSFDSLFNNVITFRNLIVLPPNYFYPLHSKFKNDIKNYKNYIKKETIGIHLWNYSWEYINEYILINRKEYSKAFVIILKNLASFDLKVYKRYLGNIKSYFK